MILKSSIAFASFVLLCPMLSERSVAQSVYPAPRDLTSVNRGHLNDTPWTFQDANIVGWAQAARAAAQLCQSMQGGAGHFTGHQELSRGVFGLKCSGPNFVWRDATAQEIAASGWPFSDVNQVNWAQAGRAAERLCASANQGFSGGHFNGHQANGKYGLFCYSAGSQWFDASDAELAATGWGFATPRLDDVQWAQAMRAATGYCQSKGFDGGFMNGHQAPNKYGVVCQKAVGAPPTPPTPERPSTWEEDQVANLPPIPPWHDAEPPEPPDPWKCQIEGRWDLNQSNQTWVTLAIEQRGDTFYGSGKHGRTAGTVEDGRIVDRDITFRIRWTDGQIGKYRGTIDREGRLKGSAYSLTNAADTVTWWANRSFKC